MSANNTQLFTFREHHDLVEFRFRLSHQEELEKSKEISVRQNAAGLWEILVQFPSRRAVDWADGFSLGLLCGARRARERANAVANLDGKQLREKYRQQRPASVVNLDAQDDEYVRREVLLGTIYNGL